MPAITSLDLSNAKLDVDHIAAIATSKADNATDRLGNIKLTMQGAVNTIKALNPRGPFSSGVQYFVKDIYTSSGNTYLATVDHTSTSVASDLAAGKIVLYQGVTFTQAGSGSVSRTVDAKLQEHFSVLDKGGVGDGVSDNLSAVLAAKSSSGRVYFPRVNDQATTYYFASLSSGNLDGLTVSADEGVTLSFPYGTYSLYKNATFISDVSVIFRDTTTNYIFPKTPQTYEKVALPIPSKVSKRVRKALDVTNPLHVIGRSVDWFTGDVFTDLSTTNTASSMSFAATTTAFKGAFVEIGPYETVSAFFDNGASPGPFGIIIRGAQGYSIVYTPGGSSNYYTAVKPIGSPVSGNTANLSWASLGQGVYTSYNAENSVWSVTRISKDKIIIKVNGKAVTQPFAPNCGDIFEIGFACFTSSAFSVSGFTVERRTEGIFGGQDLGSIRIFGDSTAEELPGAWSTYLQPILDGAFGVKLRNVTNLAVSGTDAAAAYTALTTNGTGGSRYVIIATGTNDVQQGTSLATFKSTISSMIGYVLTNGSIPVIVIPWMWYSKALAGGIGQNTANYNNGAPYRMALEQIAFSRGAVVVKTQEELPNPDPAYLTQFPKNPLLRDNIHQDQYSNQLYARIIAQAIADDFFSLDDSVETTLATAIFKNGTTPSDDFRFTVDKSGMISFSGTLVTPEVTSGTVLFKMPRWVKPARPINLSAQALSSGGISMLGSCYLNYDSVTAEVKLILAPTGTAVVIVDAAPYRTL